MSLFGFAERRRIADLEARDAVRLRRIESLEEQLTEAGLTPGKTKPSRVPALERQVASQQAALGRLTRAVRGLLDDMAAGGAS